MKPDPTDTAKPQMQLPQVLTMQPGTKAIERASGAERCLKAAQ